MSEPIADDLSIRIQRPEHPLAEEVDVRLRAELAACPDVAFAYLCSVEVVDRSPGPQLSLFVWLTPEAVGSLRPALNLVCEAVARALPEDVFLDVLILNSVSELLTRLEGVGGLIVERDPDERRRALQASTVEPGEEAPKTRRRLWPW